MKCFISNSGEWTVERPSKRKHNSASKLYLSAELSHSISLPNNQNFSAFTTQTQTPLPSNRYQQLFSTLTEILNRKKMLYLISSLNAMKKANTFSFDSTIMNIYKKAQQHKLTQLYKMLPNKCYWHAFHQLKLHSKITRVSIILQKHLLQRAFQSIKKQRTRLIIDINDDELQPYQTKGMTRAYSKSENESAFIEQSNPKIESPLNEQKQETAASPDFQCNYDSKQIINEIIKTPPQIKKVNSDSIFDQQIKVIEAQLEEIEMPQIFVISAPQSPNNQGSLLSRITSSKNILTLPNQKKERSQSVPQNILSNGEEIQISRKMHYRYLNQYKKIIAAPPQEEIVMESNQMVASSKWKSVKKLHNLLILNKGVSLPTKSQEEEPKLINILSEEFRSKERLYSFPQALKNAKKMSVFTPKINFRQLFRAQKKRKTIELKPPQQEIKQSSGLKHKRFYLSFRQSTLLIIFILLLSIITQLFIYNF